MATAMRAPAEILAAQERARADSTRLTSTMPMATAADAAPSVPRSMPATTMIAGATQRPALEHVEGDGLLDLGDVGRHRLGDASAANAFTAPSVLPGPA